MTNQKSKSAGGEERRFDPELLKKGLRCDLDQYERLTEEGVETSNKWRLENRGEDIFLEGANLGGRDLKRVYLNSGILKDDDEVWFKGKVYLKGANFYNAHLKNAHLENTHLEGASLRYADLEKAQVRNAHLEGAKLQGASLKSAHFMGATVDGNTNMWKVKVNPFRISTAKDCFFTDLSGVPLQSVIIDPATRQLIEYNIRRKYWHKWINEKNWHEIVPNGITPIKRNILSKYAHSVVHLFFWISDYGLRTLRIIGTFFVLAVAFAIVYRLWPNSVMVNQEVGDIRGFWHALYFSVVTMTTLGFGDIAANPDSWWGQTLLMMQVILGYVLLGALVTRFAVLFTAGGPAGKFADEKRKG